MTTTLGTLLTAIVTPFDDELKVDEDAFVALLHHVIDSGSDGVVVCGTTGEAATLTNEEHLRLVEIACAERPEGVTILGSTGSNDTAQACAMTERVTELGVDGVLSVTPYYNRPNRRGLVRHYTRSRRPPTSRSCSTTSRPAPRSTCRTICSPSSPRSSASTT
ncbi:hypothetical protein GCM10020366_07770 [Saccharopolyspora gregorii]|uniref:4-hydroxy-tetrahydrodipicolinate synthase n=1 Tax=Saccharopolyspora gregorii TaxID=33914 RepID=A0ABP6RIJ0_9PSEU